MVKKRQKKKNIMKGRTRLPNDFLPSDLKEYQRLRKNSLQKLRRVKDNFGLNLSEDIQIPDFDEFRSKEQFENWKEEMKDFTNRSNLEYQFGVNKYGVVYSKALEKEMSENNKIVQKNTDELFDKYKNKPFVENKQIVSTVEQQWLMTGKPELAGILRPHDFDIDKIQSTQRLYKRAETLREKVSGRYYNNRMEIMQENFVDKIRSLFNNMGDRLADKIDNMEPDDFFDMYIYFGEIDFDYLYEAEENGNEDLYRELLDTMEQYVDTYIEGGVDKILKSFPSR